MAMTDTALASLKKANERMNRAFARAIALNLISKPEVARYRRLVKRGAASRRPRTAEGLEKLAARFDRVAAWYESVLSGMTGATEYDDVGLGEVEEDLDEVPIPAHELGASRLAGVGLRHRVVLLMEGGATAQEAVSHVGIAATARSARRWYQRYRERGLDGLVDRRVRNGREVSVMTPRVRQHILGLTRQYPASGHKSLADSLRKICLEEGIEPPSYEAVKKYRISLRPEALAVAKGQTELFESKYMPVQRVERATAPNERWQLDDSDLEVWVRVEDKGGTARPARAQITFVEDVYSRAVMGAFVSTRAPDSWSVALALRDAIVPNDGDMSQPHGLPRYIHVDHGKNYMSDDTATLCARLGVGIINAPPYYPNDKGKVERWFRTLKDGRLKTIPGCTANIGKSEGAAKKRIDTLLTLPQLRRFIQDWVDSQYHQRVHSTTGMKPIDRWRELKVVRMPEYEGDLNLLMLPGETRTVGQDGIQFANRDYPVLSDEIYVGQEVHIRYLPDDVSQIAVYMTDDKGGQVFVDVAYARNQPGAPSIADTKASRNGRKKGMMKALKAYHQDVKKRDRPTLMGLANAESAAAVETARDEPALVLHEDATHFPAAEDDEVREIEAQLQARLRAEMESDD